MGFNSCILPSIETMQEQIERDGLEIFIQRYRKYDSISGESDRMKFIEEKVAEYLDKINYTPII
jgi:hypothetical protein